MSVREQILAEIAALPEDKLAELREHIRAASSGDVIQHPPKKRGIMERLREITFEGPEDFSENIDQYLSGEKHA